MWMSLLTLEIDGAVLVDIDLVDHVLELAIGGVQTEGAHDCSELVLGDLTCGTGLVSSRSVRPFACIRGESFGVIRQV